MYIRQFNDFGIYHGKKNKETNFLHLNLILLLMLKNNYFMQKVLSYFYDNKSICKQLSIFINIHQKKYNLIFDFSYKYI